MLCLTLLEGLGLRLHSKNGLLQLVEPVVGSGEEGDVGETGCDADTDEVDTVGDAGEAAGGRARAAVEGWRMGKALAGGGAGPEGGGGPEAAAAMSHQAIPR